MKKQKNFIPFFILLLFIFLNICLIINFNIKNEKNNSFFRLHILANSNNINDQIIKLKVYENVNNYIDELLKNNNSTDLNSIKVNSHNILEIANNTLKEENLDYSSSLSIGKISYDKKQSVNLDMDKGIYPSVKITLGKGEGKNIWTLISPSKENIQKVKELDTILPGIKKLYNTNSDKNNYFEDKTYDFKILEIIKTNWLS